MTYTLLLVMVYSLLKEKEEENNSTCVKVVFIYKYLHDSKHFTNSFRILDNKVKHIVYSEAIKYLISAIAVPGASPLGQVFEQFIIVWQR